MKIAKFAGKYDIRFEYTNNGDVIESASGRLYLVSKPNSEHNDRHNAINLASGGRVCFNSYTKVHIHKDAALYLNSSDLEEPPELDFDVEVDY